MQTASRGTPPLYDDIDNLDHDPALANALGNMIIAWANAEVQLAFVFGAITDIPENMAILGYYRIPTFESRIKQIRAMLEEWKPQKHDKAEIDKAVLKLSKLAKARNDWIHGVWSKERTKERTVIFDLRAPEEKGRMKYVTTSAVHNHIEAVNSRTENLRKLVPRRP